MITVEYKICFQGENFENWSLLNDAALPTVDSIIYFDGDYWEVTDVIHYPSRSAEPKTYLIAPHVLVTKVSSPLHASNQKAKAIAPADAVKEFQFTKEMQVDGQINVCFATNVIQPSPVICDVIKSRLAASEPCTLEELIGVVANDVGISLEHLLPVTILSIASLIASEEICRYAGRQLLDEPLDYSWVLSEEVTHETPIH